jgi:hypothetical protein
MVGSLIPLNWKDATKRREKTVHHQSVPRWREISGIDLLGVMASEFALMFFTNTSSML